MHEPPQVPPVQRPFLYRPSDVLDLEHGGPNELIATRLALIHGANFNDPHYFEWPSRDRMARL